MGFNDAERLQTENDLASLRERNDLVELLNQIRGK
jgi:hypothetical protein